MSGHWHTFVHFPSVHSRDVMSSTTLWSSLMALTIDWTDEGVHSISGFQHPKLWAEENSFLVHCTAVSGVLLRKHKMAQDRSTASVMQGELILEISTVCTYIFLVTVDFMVNVFDKKQTNQNTKKNFQCVLPFNSYKTNVKAAITILHIRSPKASEVTEKTNLAWSLNLRTPWLLKAPVPSGDCRA